MINRSRRRKHRWVVERSCGRLGRQRRLSKAYEYLTATSESIIYIATIGLMLRRFAPSELFSDALWAAPTAISRLRIHLPAAYVFGANPEETPNERNHVVTKNALTSKEEALVGIGAAVAAGCRPCTRTLIRAARAAGACERGIRLAIETGLYAGTSAMRTMAEWAETEQGAAPGLDAAFRAEKDKLTALILAGASLAANSGELLGRYLAEAEALDWSKPELAAALAAAHTVAKNAATAVEQESCGLGYCLPDASAEPCPGQAEAPTAAPPAAGGCGCAKGAGCT